MHAAQLEAVLVFLADNVGTNHQKTKIANEVILEFPTAMTQ